MLPGLGLLFGSPNRIYLLRNARKELCGVTQKVEESFSMDHSDDDDGSISS